MTGDLDAILTSKEVVISCGSGGVGKTTLSASLALRAAMLGKKAIVCTIDPARRLANSLGLSELGNEEVEVSRERLGAAGLEPKGSLWAMMLDTKRTFDKLIERYATTDEMRKRVLENRFYQEISSQVVGSQEYMAMEKLYELHETGRYDLIVLDTPPTKHALDFLTAPKRMTNVLDKSVLDYLLKPFDLAGKLSMGIMAVAAKRVAKKIDQLIGLQFVHDLTEFFRAFEGLYEGFRARAANVEKLLREPFTAFVVVAAPMPIPLEEARFFCEKLRELSMPLAAIVLNRVHPSPLAAAPEAARDAVRKALERGVESAGIAARSALGAGAAATAVEKAIGALVEQEILARGDRKRIQELEAGAARSILLREIPRFPDDVHDLAGLKRMNEALFGPLPAPARAPAAEPSP